MEPVDPTLVSMRVRRAKELGFTPDHLRSQLWEHSAHGIVRPTYFVVDHTAARISDAVALMSDLNTLGGWASLNIQGNQWFDGSDSSRGERAVLVHCWPGSQLRLRPGIRPSEGLVLPDEVISLERYSVTSLARAAYDEMRLARNLREAVVVLDMATSTTSSVAHTSPTAVARVVASHHKTRGIVQARRALSLGNPRSASPWETRTRLVAQLDADILDLRVNAPVFDLNENLLGVADLIDPQTGLVIESDGGDHREAARHTDDNVREEKFERAGAVVCRVTSLDHRDKRTMVGRMVAAKRDAQHSTRKLWTLDQPDWWRPWPPARRWD